MVSVMKLIITKTFKTCLGNRIVAVTRFHDLRYITTNVVDFNYRLLFKQQKNNFS